MSLEIANTIRKQLFAFGKMKVYSWGVNNWVGGENWLSFRVRARRHKGYVKITLNGMDLYDIQLISTHGNIKKEFNNIYFDQMTEVIDNEIENVPAYSN
jgi:hypothetical protein